jgi:hypothetical protein
MAHDMGEDRRVQRPQLTAGLAHPVAERGAVEADAAAGEDLTLPTQRQAIAVFHHQEEASSASVGGPPATIRAGAGACCTPASWKRRQA